MSRSVGSSSSTNRAPEHPILLHPGAMPTLEQWTDSITAVLDDLGSREAVLVAIDGAVATGAVFAATHPSRTTALVVLEGYADATDASGLTKEAPEALAAMWGTGEFQHLVNPDMPWNERDPGNVGTDGTPGGKPHGPSLSCWRSCRKWMCGQCFPQSECRHSSSSTPTTR